MIIGTYSVPPGYSANITETFKLNVYSATYPVQFNSVMRPTDHEESRVVEVRKFCSSHIPKKKHCKQFGLMTSGPFAKHLVMLSSPANLSI